jgi:hypothetical protein
LTSPKTVIHSATSNYLHSSDDKRHKETELRHKINWQKRAISAPNLFTAAKLRLAMAAMGQPETKTVNLCEELGITRQTLYRHVSSQGELHPDAAILKVASAADFGDSQIAGKMIHRKDEALAIPSSGFESRLRRLSGPPEGARR